MKNHDIKDRLMTAVRIPGSRDVRGTLDDRPVDRSVSANEASKIETVTGESVPLVIACPPHPRHGGTRSDRRLIAVSERLGERAIACLRIDYGAWDEGIGECEDVRNTLRWATDDERFGAVGVFGYSFGATVGLIASATADRDVAAVSTLAPTARLGPNLDAVQSLDSLVADSIPIQVVFGERDSTVDWEPIVERASERGGETKAISADHFFVGQQDTVSGHVGDFFDRQSNGKRSRTE